jgi:hypothetical protein
MEFRLTNDRHGSITLGSFLERREAVQFEKSIAERANAMLDALDKETLRLYYERGLRVILTGGGATLPMIQSVTRGESVHHGLHLRRELGPLVPPSIENTPLASEYLPLAVAIGAAYPLPSVGSELKKVGGAGHPIVIPAARWC